MNKEAARSGHLVPENGEDDGGEAGDESEGWTAPVLGISLSVKQTTSLPSFLIPDLRTFYGSSCADHGRLN